MKLILSQSYRYGGQRTKTICTDEDAEEDVGCMDERMQVYFLINSLFNGDLDGFILDKYTFWDMTDYWKRSLDDEDFKDMIW